MFKGAGFAGIMLLNPSAEIGGVTDVEASIFFTLKDVNVIHVRRDRDFPLSAGYIPQQRDEPIHSFFKEQYTILRRDRDSNPGSRFPRILT